MYFLNSRTNTFHQTVFTTDEFFVLSSGLMAFTISRTLIKPIASTPFNTFHTLNFAGFEFELVNLTWRVPQVPPYCKRLRRAVENSSSCVFCHFFNSPSLYNNCANFYCTKNLIFVLRVAKICFNVAKYFRLILALCEEKINYAMILFFQCF